MDLLAKRDDLHTCRVVDGEVGDLKPDQVRPAIDFFGLTTNNITYAVFGEAMSYWAFFPAEEGWGRMPVWGFATVEAGSATDLEEGRRIFGYLPPASHLVVTPAAVDARGFVDAARHRADLPAAYNRYAFADVMGLYEARFEAEQMLLWPLFFTSFLIDDFLAGEALFGAAMVVLSSASSKTALAAAFQLQRARESRSSASRGPSGSPSSRAWTHTTSCSRIRTPDRSQGRPRCMSTSPGTPGSERRSTTTTATRCDTAPSSALPTPTGSPRRKLARCRGRRRRSSSPRTTCGAADRSGGTRASMPV
jgi:Protein of unknown function (DUF2855)